MHEFSPGVQSLHEVIEIVDSDDESDDEITSSWPAGGDLRPQSTDKTRAILSDFNPQPTNAPVVFEDWHWELKTGSGKGKARGKENRIPGALVGNKLHMPRA
jgi:hypothetical protein